MISLPDRLVLFDYGDVISEPQSNADRAALVAEAGVPPEAFWHGYQTHRDELDAGRIDAEEYWRRVGGELGADWDDAAVQRLWTLDVRSWVSANPAVVHILVELAAGGTRLALLSNAAPEYASLFRFAPTGRFFERILVSGELRMLKPEPEIYRHAADELGIDPRRIVFVDNREENVRGAEAVGMTGHVFTGAAALRGFLASLS